MQGFLGAEDTSGSWRMDLAVEVATLADAECTDADGDGFVDAWTCPSGDPATLDCDDQDASVGPDQERFVRGGPFLMGSVSQQAGSDEGPVEVVTLSSYCLDTHELSAALFSTWLVAEARMPAGTDVRSLSPIGALQPGRAQHPAEGVTWDEAHDYCQAQGKQLPTEAQWEKAARGGCEHGQDPARCDAQDLRPYPWGTEAPSCERANHASVGQGGPSLCESDTWPVDRGNQGPYGHINLAGNVWDEGRRLNAGQLLLWRAVCAMKEHGIRWFDVSGLDPDLTPPGIRTFKEGLSGVPYRLAPELEALGGGPLGRLVRWRVRRARAAG